MARIIQTGDLRPDTPMTENDSEWIYNGLDCAVTLEVFEAIQPQLDNTTASTYQFSLDLQAPVLEMTTRGLLVDQHQRKKVLKLYQNQIIQLDEQLTKLVREGVGVPVENKIVKGEIKYWWRSTSQLKNLLYDVMGLPIQRKRNANGVMAPSTDRNALEKLQYYFLAEPIILHLLALRDVDKKRGWLETEIDPDGRMRTNLNIAGTNTGRLASAISDFGTGNNLQNIDRDLRSVFIADPGMKFGNLDLEQADSRNLGAFCWNAFLSTHGEDFAGTYLTACESGDLHTTVSKMARPQLPWTGDRVADRAIADTIFYRSMSYRDLDKRLGHGSNYLGQPRTMAKHSRVPVGEVEQFQGNYFRAFKCIPAYHQLVRNDIKQFGLLHNLFNRRRFFFGRYNDEATIREAVAFGPQSSTAEQINIGMLRVWRANKVQLLIQVHDSILFQYPEHLEDEIIPWALNELKVIIELSGGRQFFVPTEAKVGWNWGDYDVKNPDKNPEGLVKWKGHDDRKRSRLTPLSLSL